MEILSYPLVVENLSRNFGALQAVDHASFSVSEGELQAIIGPNGAGKTTLFNLISGELRPSTGRIYLFGQDVTKMSCQRRAYLGLGRTFQITNLFPELTVLENIFLAIQAQKRLKFVFYRPQSSYHTLLERANKTLEEWGLWEKRDTLAQNLSHGDQRQLDIILALVEEPKLLLLDEPTAGLSRAETIAVTEIIRTFSQGRTTLMIEHDMEVAFGLAQRITVLHQGRVFADGSPDEIRGDPRVREIYMGAEEGTENAGAS